MSATGIGWVGTHCRLLRSIADESAYFRLKYGG